MDQRQTMPQQDNKVVVAIVGMGIRGLGVLERLVAHCLDDKSRAKLELHLIDASRAGPDQYAVNQPDYLLLNIVASQVSLFPDPRSVASVAPIEGPSLFEWARARGLRLAPDLLTLSPVGRPIEEGDFLPRSLMGHYLLWARAHLVAMAPAWLSIVEHVAVASALETGERGAVALEPGGSLVADFLFVTIGQFPEPHSGPPGTPGLIERPYPLPARVAAIKASETVAIAGLGLTMMDLVLALTVERGGRFVGEGSAVRYLPSGREPRMIAYSRTGLPYRSRPALGAPLGYEPIIFTRRAIDRLRQTARQLDFDRNVMPLILQELRIAYERARIGARNGWSAADQFIDELRRRDPKQLGEALEELCPEATDAAFDAASLFAGFDADWACANRTSTSYFHWLRSFLERDVTLSFAGVAASPEKAALESLREFRDIIRYAVDYGGVTKSSLERFYRVHAPALNRIGVGPQKERNAELLALVRAGLLAFPLGPSPEVSRDERGRWRLRSTALVAPHAECADWLCHASIPRTPPLDRSHRLVGKLAEDGIITRLIDGSSVVRGIEVDRNNHPIDASGQARQRLWVLGPLEEGSTFYTGFLPSSGKFDRSAFDADRAVEAILAAANIGST
jgi:hypothetical protein